MATMAEIEQGWPERRDALVAAMGTMTLAEFGERLTAGVRDIRPALSLGDGWLPVTEARLQVRHLTGPGLDPLVFGPPAGGAPRLTGLAELGARLLEWARQVIADFARALRPLFERVGHGRSGTRPAGRLDAGERRPRAGEDRACLPAARDTATGRSAGGLRAWPRC
jgi:hypothetical protein